MESGEPFKVTPEIAAAVIAKTGGRCWYCGKALGEFAATWQADHQVPRSRGGSHELGNLVPACFSCNSGKSNRSVEHYRSVRRWQLPNALNKLMPVVERQWHLHPEKRKALIEALTQMVELASSQPVVFFGERHHEP